MKRERVDFLNDNPHFTERVAFYVGRRCRQASIRDVATELKLDWDTVKTLERQYMRARLKRAGTPGPGDRDQSGIICQIYPRSFQGGNDLKGMVDRLDHLIWLGVDAVWISPIYPSPMEGFRL